MATWQCDFSAAQRQGRKTSVTEIVDAIDKKIHRLPAWSEYLYYWGNEEGNCVILVANGSDWTSIAFRVDARQIDSDFISLVSQLCTELCLVLRDSTGAIVKSDVTALEKAVKTSAASEFVFSPDMFFARWQRGRQERRRCDDGGVD